MVDNAIESFRSLNNALTGVDECFDILLRNDSAENIYDNLKVLESAKLKISMAYSVASLYYILLKSKVIFIITSFL